LIILPKLLKNPQLKKRSAAIRVQSLMFRCFSLLALLLFLNSYGQIDPIKLDSLARSIDSSAKALQLTQDSFVQAQDSIYRSALDNTLQRQTKFVEEERRKEKYRQQVTLRIIAVVVFIIAVGLFFWIRRKRKI